MTVGAFLRGGERTFDALAYATLHAVTLIVRLALVILLLAVLGVLGAAVGLVVGTVVLCLVAGAVAGLIGYIVKDTWRILREQGLRWMLADMRAAWRGEKQIGRGRR